MSNLPLIVVVTAAAAQNASLVLEAWGRGPNTFTQGRKLTTDPAPTSGSVVTHRLVHDGSTDQATVAVFQGFANGDLPPLPNGASWGVDGIIDAASALAAISGASMQTFSASGDVIPTDHMMAVIETLGLKLVPDPEI